MSELKFWEAMKAVDEGKTVQYCAYGSKQEWSDFKGGTINTTDAKTSIKWRLKPEPVKYSVDVWLQSTPAIAAKAGTLGQYLVGENNYWELKEGHNYKHYRITVESVECGE